MWNKVKRPQFILMVVFCVVLVVVSNTGLKVSTEMLAAMTAAVVGWIGAESYVDRQKAADKAYARDQEKNRASYRNERPVAVQDQPVSTLPPEY